MPEKSEAHTRKPVSPDDWRHPKWIIGGILAIFGGGGVATLGVFQFVDKEQVVVEKEAVEATAGELLQAKNKIILLEEERQERETFERIAKEREDYVSEVIESSSGEILVEVRKNAESLARLETSMEVGDRFALQDAEKVILPWNEKARDWEAGEPLPLFDDPIEVQGRRMAEEQRQKRQSKK